MQLHNPWAAFSMMPYPMISARPKKKAKPLLGFSGVIDLLEEIVRDKPGALIYLGQEFFPDLSDHIFDNASRLASADFFQLLSSGGKEGYKWDKGGSWDHPDVASHVGFSTAFCGKDSRGTKRMYHLHLDQVPYLFDKSRPDVAIVAISQTDEYGMVTLGLDAGLSDRAVRRARIRIGIQNMEAPRFRVAEIESAGTKLLSGCHFNESDFDYIVRVWHKRPKAEPLVLPEHVKRMGRAIATFVPNGANFQAGIGAGLVNPDNMLMPEFYVHHEGLKARAELTGMHAAELAMQQDAGDIWTSFVTGPQEYVSRLDRDSDIGRRLVILPAEQMVNTQFILKHCPGPLFSLAGALAIDAEASVASAGIGTRPFSGVGGAFRYADAAVQSKGESIVVMPATYTDKTGEHSRIVSTHVKGTPVTLSVRTVTRICTEYGITPDLHFMDSWKRAACMVMLAAPQFRDELAHAIQKEYEGYPLDLTEAADLVSFERLGV